MTVKKPTLVIVDSDTLIFTSTYKVNSADEALNKCKGYLYNVFKETEANYYIGFLTSSSHRYEIAQSKEYKGNRKFLEKPSYFKLITEYLKDEFKMGILQNKEADDLCISAYYKYKDEYNCIISSPDKDLRQIEALFHNPKTGKIDYITADQAEYNFYYQMLKGDTGDNIPGIPGIGEVKATTILKEAVEKKQDLFTVVLNSYVTYYKIPAVAYNYFSENYLLLYLQRNIEFDYVTNIIDYEKIDGELEKLINGKEFKRRGEFKETELETVKRHEETAKPKEWF